ncbi:hypothetical protein FKM82_000115 [Ascaphus truei]
MVCVRANKHTAFCAHFPDSICASSDSGKTDPFIKKINMNKHIIRYVYCLFYSCKPCSFSFLFPCVSRSALCPKVCCYRLDIGYFHGDGTECFVPVSSAMKC